MYSIGSKIQDFCLKDQRGQTHCLSSYLGKKVILYFYPKDMTPGCTTQACAFKALHESFEERNCVIIGISKDSVESHLKFADRYELPFVVLSDDALEVSTQFGVYQQKSLWGRKYMGIMRTTFIIDEKGVLLKVYEKASPSKNATEILKWIESN